jgi:hypothetical protein
MATMSEKMIAAMRETLAPEKDMTPNGPYGSAVISILGAMKEPTPQMLRAGAMAIRMSQDDANAVWQAMLREALAD